VISLDEEAAHSGYSWKRDPLLWLYSVLMFLRSSGLLFVLIFFTCSYVKRKKVLFIIQQKIQLFIVGAAVKYVEN
jgi:hypothetical protein